MRRTWRCAASSERRSAVGSGLHKAGPPVQTSVGRPISSATRVDRTGARWHTVRHRSVYSGVCRHGGGRSLKGRHVVAALTLDNGSEFIGRALEVWAIQHGVQPCFIPGRQVENGFIESFNGRLRDECLNVEWFGSLHEARVRLARCRDHYNLVLCCPTSLCA
jgi:transposase InsO family protein